MPYSLRRTVAPTVEPVLWAEAKLYCRIDDDTEQATVEALIAAARHTVEELTQKQLITATWVRTLDRFPETHPIDLPRGPLASVASISYTDENGDAQTLAASGYQVDLVNDPGRILPGVDLVWPDTRANALNTVTITYTAGYGATGASVPPPLIQAILMLVSHWFEHREAVALTQMSEVPFAVQRLVSFYRAMVQR